MKPWSLLSIIAPSRLDDYKRIQEESYYELDSGESLPSPSMRRRNSPLQHRRRFSFVFSGYSISFFLPRIQHVVHTIFTLRKMLLLLFVSTFLLVTGILSSGVPSTYKDVRAFERRLPQHNVTKAVEERIGRDGVRERIHRRRYLRFDGALWGHGLNNVLQESFVMAHIAELAHRSFVFEDHVWSKSPLPYTLYDFALRPSRIPLNAFISGPSAGGPLPDGSISHRAVSLEFFQQVCSPEEIVVVHSSLAPVDAKLEKDANEIVRWFVDELRRVEDEPCVVIASDGRTLFDRELFGTKRILSLFPALFSSPILANFQWSPLVNSAVSRNFAILQPDKLEDLYPATPGAAPSVLEGVVAVHLRRGDYKRHCYRLVGWDDEYMGVNQWEPLPDRFDADAYLREQKARMAASAGAGTHTRSRQEVDNSHWNHSSSSTVPYQRTSEDHSILTPYYIEHCLPEIPEIVERLHIVRRDNPTLRRVYLLSNGWVWWLQKLSAALKADGWEDVIGGTEGGLGGAGGLVLDRAQQHVAMAVDMAIAEKAEVFVGNGFSSLSGNVVTLRLAKGFRPETNRFL